MEGEMVELLPNILVQGERDTCVDGSEAPYAIASLRDWW